MNSEQSLWFAQANSDYGLFLQLRQSDCAACHVLHYLQMATEKLSKAYLWRSRHAPPRVHTGFVRFLRALLTRNSPDLERIAKIFNFGRPEDFDNWTRSVLPLAYRVQNIAPAEANDGPNPEYPWPHLQPAYAPATYDFPLLKDLTQTQLGGHLMDFIDWAVKNFPAYC